MIDLYQIITSIIIGIIEGITEFLPISSTGHMIIASYYLNLNIENNNIKILEILTQLGSSLSILYFFRKKILKIIKSNILKKKINNIHILCAIAPTIFLGLMFYKKIKKLFNIQNVIIGLISGGLLLFFSEIFKPKKYKIYNIYNISILQSTIIGIFQILSLYPGFSRSGVTIATAILLGIKKSVAIEFSFIISVPLLIGVSFFDLSKHLTNIKILDIPIFFIGFTISFLVSLIFVRILLKILNNTSLIFFGIYRFTISGLIYFFSLNN
ncbi:undecaprenyl-diphosphate phosphatase [Buchnera aphidicola (Macrosiphoniella sanborni)]|uniref:Undecaprenyl-diphosphatase n=1 Tax=Buchnera aphidicola (Macrosiphoniella sanborni) TaxID=1241865 RepID=A0A4D6Y202_9GAMM|nr:undecaprenyl-diphosphate phosphatase [Buchnera aphidicola]QCI23632.1 undecaprenyl-diphosphate phosphatase [Buchnera aphidicola (Macrosiphoniella sanborni)]